MCTVTQVEEVKILARMLPIIANTVIMNTCLAQLQTFSVLQGYFMDPHIGSIKIPTASIPVIPLLFMAILIPVYEFLVVLLARKLTGNPSGITQLQRVGVGLVLSIVSMAVAGVIEVRRREHALLVPPKIDGLFWLSFQYGLFGYFLCSAFLSIVNVVTKRATSNKQGWLESPFLNNNKLQLFYWF